MNSTLEPDRSLDLNKFRRHIVTAYTISRPPKNCVSHLLAHKQSSAETTREIHTEFPNSSQNDHRQTFSIATCYMKYWLISEENDKNHKILYKGCLCFTLLRLKYQWKDSIGTLYPSWKTKIQASQEIW